MSLQEKIPKGKAQEKKKLKKDALLNTAFELFTKQGINNTSISNIVDAAGVAKGTFYLYFKDKYDIRNRLIAHKASELFLQAKDALPAQNNASLEDTIIFISDFIIDVFAKDKILLSFISKNLSWGIFKSEFLSVVDSEEVDFPSIFEERISSSPIKYKNPEVMIYLIIELISSSSYSAILYNEPLSIEELKPYLHQSIHGIMKANENLLPPSSI